MSVDPRAREGFGRAAAEYERGRPGYAPAAVAFLVARLGLAAGRTVVDLAAGTGKLARALVASGARVIAVEPVAEMRALLPARVEAVDGVAEAIPLEDGSVDAVVAAQAFHWFRPREALVEIARVLRPGGGLAIVRNERDLSDPAQRAFRELLARHRAHPPLESRHDARAELARSGLWEEPEVASFAHVAELDVVALAASESSIALLDDARRAAALAEFARLGDCVPLRYVTTVLTTRARTQRARRR